MSQETSPIPAPQKPAASASNYGVTRSFGTFRTVWALMLREMSTRYGRSPGGYIWAIIEPIGTIFLLAAGFSLLIRSPSLGNSFILFYATGFLPFSVYQQVSVMVSRSIVFSRPLLYYPAVTWWDAVVARLFLNALTAIMTSYIIMAIILSFTETRTVLDVQPIITAMTMAIAFGFGVGVLNCALTGLSAAWEQAWSIATRPLFLASGVIYIYEDMPQSVQNILWYNPLIHISGLARSGFYPMYEASYANIPYLVICALVPVTLGLILLGRYHRDILEKA